MSPAMAPRSPMWLARRSSSSATARRVWARGDFRLRASASMAPQYAPTWPITLSPEHDLEEEHVFAMRLETEMAGFDHSGVNRPDRHLMNFLAGHAVERIGDGIENHRPVPRRAVVGQV